MTLLEEPLAALYAWIAAHRRRLAASFADGALILVCDVGGGTTDFSLIRARDRGRRAGLRADRDRRAPAARRRQPRPRAGRRWSSRSSPIVWTAHACAAAGAAPQVQRGEGAAAVRHRAPISVTITLLGSGRGVVGGGMTTELTREEVVADPDRGVSAGHRARRSASTRPTGRTARARLAVRNRTGDHATSRRRFSRARRGEPAAAMMRPDAVLFNGGFFTPARARDRVLDALAGWFGDAAAGARERGPRVGGGDRRGVLRQAAPGSGGLEAPADPGGQRQVVLHRRRCRARHAGRAVRDAARNGGGHPRSISIARSP